jgi:hypothetical protein
MPPDQPPAGDDAKDAAAERLVAFQRDALEEIEIATAEDLDGALQVLSDATLAHVLATSPLSPDAEEALPEHVRDLLRKARRSINQTENRQGAFPVREEVE